MTPDTKATLEYALVAYAKMYVKDPALRTNASEAMRPLELKIVELCGDTDWYPDIWPGTKDVVFFWWAEPNGLTSQCIVDTITGRVHWYRQPL